MKFLLLVTLTCVVLFFTPLSNPFQVVKIGGIFFHDELDLMRAFERAISDVNQQEFDVRLEAVKHFLVDDDSIVLQQLTCDLIESGVSAIFGPSSKAKNDIVEVICNITGIPHLQFDWHAPETLAHRHNHQMTVNVAPSESLLSTAYSDILRSTDFDWKSYTIVYESNESLARMQQLLAWKHLHKNGIKIRRFERGQDYRILWKHISNSREKFVLLDCPADIVTDVVNASIFFNMTGPFNHLLLTNLDTHLSQLPKLYSKDFNVATAALRLRPFIPPPVQHEVDVFEEAEDEEEEILAFRSMLLYDAVILFFNALRSLVHSFHYAPPQQSCGRRHFWKQGRQILYEMKIFKPKSVLVPPYKTQKMQLNEFGEREDFNLEIYNPMIGKITHVWNKNHLLVSYDRLNENSTKKSKKGHTEMQEDFSKKRLRLTVSTRIGEPYFMWRQEPEGIHYEGNERFEGYAVDLIYKLAEECKFDFVFDPVADNNYGSHDPVTDEWNGIIRQLIDNNAQLGICDLTITQARRSVVDFTVPFMQLGVSILYYKAPPPPKELFTFLKHFALEVWMYLLIALLIAAVMLVITARMSADEWENPILNDQNVLMVENKWSLINTFWLLIGSIVTAGCDILPRGASMRLFTAFWWIFALVISQTYLAKLTSVITSSKLEGSIRNLHDLVDQNKVQFGTVKGGSTSLLFSESNESDFRVAWNKMIAMKPEAFTASNKEGVDRVRRSHGRYAFLMETTNLQYYMERNCELTQIGSSFGEKHYGIAVPLNAPYRSNLSVGILKLSEKGVLYQLKNKWFNSNETNCNLGADAATKDDNKYSMDSVMGLFVILAGGIAVAVLFGIAEFLRNVQRIAVETRMSNMHILRSELKFVVKFWLTRKPLHTYRRSRDTSSTRVSCHEQSITTRSDHRTSNKKPSRRKKKYPKKRDDVVS